MGERQNKPMILITGGHGFIGSHVAQRLYKQYRIRIVDTACSVSHVPCDEFVEGNVCDPMVCNRVVQGVHTVLHFAANMGGMGTIHDQNDFIIYKENHTMTCSILFASIEAGVKRFFYASSACVYPEVLQVDTSTDVSLRETDVYVDSPPKPQGLYGLEKLISEQLILQQASRIDIRIARFHNVYGPGGAWMNGREKAPAAMLRKALALKHVQANRRHFEIWGDGSQRRSFLWIEDAVDGILRLLDSTYSQPVNIGSEHSVSIQDLADIALDSAGILRDDVEFQYVDKPVGVASRNSNNDIAFKELGWHPEVSLEKGMQRTAEWMEKQLDTLIASADRGEFCDEIFEGLLSSKLVDLNSERIVFAILLPITSRGSSSPHDCITNLASFTKSLVQTTWRDVHEPGGTKYHIKVYLAIDKDDAFLSDGKAEAALKEAGIIDVVTIVCDYPKGHVCSLWRRCAKQAFDDGCDYLTLMGDDVTIEDEGWMRHTHQEFLDISRAEGVPLGFGCVAFTDTTFPGMPTFPIIHHTHMKIFDEVIPEIFVNQDGDPYLFQLYRRWSCSRMFSCRIRNSFGGNGPARYTKQHVVEWSFETLDNGVLAAENWLRKSGSKKIRNITLDIVVPCYRVQIPLLERILTLKASPTCSVMFIVIIDNPNSPNIAQLLRKHGHRHDVRIRVNKKNLGASSSRNRGMQEASADWIHFLDDDITPQEDLLVEAEKIIRAYPNAAGFVCNAIFPKAESIFTTAVHLAGVTYFWDIATKMKEDLPWGVTANLIARRNVKDNVSYDEQFPKTGGGEDIDFCRKKRQYFLENGKEGFYAAPNVVVTHPWWHDGNRSYWRFYGWSLGDGALVKKYPEHTYFDFSPNSAELFFLSFILGVAGGATGIWSWSLFAAKLVLSIILANIIHDIYRHLWRDVARTKEINSTVTQTRWVAAIVESSVIRMVSEGGRVASMLGRLEFLYLGSRFDWFAGRWGDGPKNEERRNSVERVALAIAVVAAIM